MKADYQATTARRARDFQAYFTPPWHLTLGEVFCAMVARARWHRRKSTELHEDISRGKRILYQLRLVNYTLRQDIRGTVSWSVHRQWPALSAAAWAAVQPWAQQRHLRSESLSQRPPRISNSMNY